MNEDEGPAVLLPQLVVGTSLQYFMGLSADIRPSSPKASASSSGVKGDGSGDGSTTSGSDSSPDGDGTTGMLSPRPIFLVARAACGASHTVLVSTSGEAWVCGRNRTGQLGLDPEGLAETFSPVRVPLLLGSEENNGRVGVGVVASAGEREGASAVVSVVQAAAGRAHTMLLLSDGRVLGFGSDEFCALGLDRPGSSTSPTAASAETGTTAPQSWHWQPREIEALRGQCVASVSAGGEQSFVITVGPSSQATHPSGAERAAAIKDSAEVEASSCAAEEDRTAVDRSEGTVLSGKAAEVMDVAAKGDDARVGGVGSAGTLPLYWQGSEALFRRRRFSIPLVTPMRTANDFLKLLREVKPREGENGDTKDDEPPDGLNAVIEVSPGVNKTILSFSLST